MDRTGEKNRAGIFKQSVGARSQVGLGLLYRAARLHRLAEFIPGNRFLAPQTFKNTGSGLFIYVGVGFKTSLFMTLSSWSVKVQRPGN